MVRRTVSDSLRQLRASFGPWIEQLPGGQGLVRAVNQLHRANSLNRVGVALHEIFVELLGFDDAPLSLTNRFESQKSFAEVHRVAQFSEFTIVACQLATPLTYPNIFNPIFAAFPYALIFAQYPFDRNLRVAYRRIEKDGEPRIRGIRGARFTRDPGENLLTWARRLALLRPQFTDDAQSLRRKTHAALELDLGSLALGWQSTAIDDTNLPGTSWEDSVKADLELCFQRDVPHSSRLHWGLNAALQNLFPLLIAGGAGQIDLIDYRIEPPKSRPGFATLELDLGIVLRDANPEHLTISARLPVPDDLATFELNGTRYRYEPSLDSSGRYFEELKLDDQGLADDFSASFDVDDEDDDQTEVDGAPADDDPIADLTGYRGVAVAGLLNALVERRVGSIARRLWRTKIQSFDAAEDVARWILRYYGESGQVLLTTERHLQQLLTAVTEDKPELRIIHSNSPQPPAWACLDLSRELRAGTWYPIAGARLHPANTLAVAIQTESGSTVLAATAASATTTNLRVAGTPPGPPEPWVAAPLRQWASCSAGTVGRPRKLATDSFPFSERSALIHGEQLGAWISPRVEASLPPDWLEIRERVPSSDLSKAQPLVGEGEHLDVGAAWLAIDADVYAGWLPTASHRFLRTLRRIGGLPTPKNKHRFRLGPTEHGTVTAYSAEPEFGPLGTVVAWTHTLRLVRKSRAAAVVARDGTAYPVKGVLLDEEAAWRPDGSTREILLTSPHVDVDIDDEAVFTGTTGELIDGREAEVSAVILARRDPSERTTKVHRSLISGDLVDPSGRFGIPAADLTWLRLACPEVARTLSEIEEHHVGSPGRLERLRALAVAAGVPAPAMLPSEWRGRPDARAVSFDPSRTGLKRVPAQYTGRHHFGRTTEFDEERAKGRALFCTSPTVFQCDCGSLRGPDRRGENCVGCGTTVRLVRRDTSSDSVPFIQLPTTFLHPWYYDDAARTLEIRREDLLKLVSNYGGTHLVRALRRRLPEGVKSSIFVDRVHVAEPVLMPLGLPRGAPDVIDSPLAAKYRALAHAADEYERLGRNVPAWLWADAWIGVQTELEDLFGHADQTASGFGSFAELLVLLSHPDDRSPALLPPGYSERTVDGDPRRFLYWRGSEVQVPEPQERVADVSRDESWVRRHYAVRLRTEHLSFLAALLGRLDDCDDFYDWVSTSRSVRAVLEDTDVPTLGRLVLQEMLRLIDRSDISAEGIVRLVEGRLPVSLPAIPTDALDAFRTRLALGSTGPTVELVEAGLFYVMGNWWSNESSWEWLRPSASPNGGGRRAVPGRSSAAWEHWKETLYATAPVRWFREGCPSNNAVRAMLGVFVDVPRSIVAAVELGVSPQTTADAMPLDEDTSIIAVASRPVATPAQVTSDGVRVMSGTMKEWLEEVSNG